MSNGPEETVAGVTTEEFTRLMITNALSPLRVIDGIHDGDLMLWFSKARPVTVYAQEIHPGTNKYPDGGWAMAD